MSSDNDPGPSHPPPQPAPQTNSIPNTSFQPVPNNQNLSNQQQMFLNQAQGGLGQQPGQNFFYHPNGINQQPGLLSGQHIAPVVAVNNPQLPGSSQYFIQITPCGGQLAVQAPPVLLNNQMFTYVPQQLAVNTTLAAAAAAQQQGYHSFSGQGYNNHQLTPQPQPPEVHNPIVVQPTNDNAVQQHVDNNSQQLMADAALTAAAAQQQDYHPFPGYGDNNFRLTPQPQPPEVCDANAVQPPIDSAVRQHADSNSQQLVADIVIPTAQQQDAWTELTNDLRTDDTEIERCFLEMCNIKSTIRDVKTMINNARDWIDAADEKITMADSAIDKTFVSMYKTWDKHKQSCYHLIGLPVQKHDSEESSGNVDASNGENVVEDSGGASRRTEPVPSSGPESDTRVFMSASDDGSANSLKIDRESVPNRGYSCGLLSPREHSSRTSPRGGEQRRTPETSPQALDPVDASIRSTMNSPRALEPSNSPKPGSTPGTNPQAIESTQRVSVPKNNNLRGTKNPSCEGGQSTTKRSTLIVPPRASTTEQIIPAVLAILEEAEKLQKTSATSAPSSAVLQSDPQRFPSLQDAQSIHITRAEKRAQAALTEPHVAVTTGPTPVSTQIRSYASALSAKKPTTQFDIEAALAKTEGSKKPTASLISKALEEQKVPEATATSTTSKPLKAPFENIPPRAEKTALATPAIVPKKSEVSGTRHVQQTKGFIFKPFQRGLDSEEGNKFSRNQQNTDRRSVALPNVLDEFRRRKLTESYLSFDENPEPEPGQPSTSGLKPVAANLSFFKKHLETREKMVSVTVEEIEEDEVTETVVSQERVTTPNESTVSNETDDDDDESVEEDEESSDEASSESESSQHSTPEPRPIPTANLSSSKKKKKSHKKKTEKVKVLPPKLEKIKVVRTDIEKAAAIEKAKMAIHIEFYCKDQRELRETNDKETLEKYGLGWLTLSKFKTAVQNKERIKKYLDLASQTQWIDMTYDIRRTLELNRKTMFYQALLSEYGNYRDIIDQDITRIMVIKDVTKNIYVEKVMDYLDIFGWPHLQDHIKHQCLPEDKDPMKRSGLVKELTDARKKDKTEYCNYAEQPFFLKRMNLHSEKAESDEDSAFYAACYGVLEKKSQDTTSERQLDKIGRLVLNFDFNYLSQLSESAPECIDEKEQEYIGMFYFNIWD